MFETPSTQNPENYVTAHTAVYTSLVVRYVRCSYTEQSLVRPGSKITEIPDSGD